MTSLTASDLRAEAEACRQAASGNGEYNTAFWVASVVLENLATRVERSGPPDHSASPAVRPQADAAPLPGRSK